MRSKNRQLLPEPNDRYVQVPGRQGSVHFPREFTDRHIDIDCAFVEKSLPDLRARAREIAAWLHTTDRAILSFDDETDKYYRGKLLLSVDFTHLATMGELSLTFLCDPLAYGGEITKDFDWFVTTVENPGTYESPPIFKMTFTAADINIRVIGPDLSMLKVVHNFRVGDILEINAATGAVLINGTRAMDKLDWQNSRFFSLKPGPNNISVASTVSTDSCTTKVSWIPRYL